MTIEKRGSEKLLETQNELCTLSIEELLQVAGGAQPVSLIDLKDYFPHGIFPSDLLRKKIPTLRSPLQHGKFGKQLTVPEGMNISNGF